MRLVLTPDAVTQKSTISRLYVDGVFECYVLEPPNPIPAGTYTIKIQPSVKFGRLMPFLIDVPGHAGIEIHNGNTAADTRDCLLVGRTVSTDFVGESVLAFDALFNKLEQPLAEPRSIEITRQATTPAAQPGANKMPDPVATPALGPLQIHPKVAVYTIVIVLINTLIATAKAHGWFDVTGDGTTISTTLAALAAYYTPGD